MAVVTPDLNWYTSISRKKQLQSRCPFATADACPRFFQSLSLLGSAGSTQIDPDEDKRLVKDWKKSDLWPKTAEYATSVSGPDGKPKHFSVFCPEVAFDRFGYFASDLCSYADDLDTELAHKSLSKEGAKRGDWRWSWASVTPLHYTDCSLYSVLLHRSHVQGPVKNESLSKKAWYERPLGIIIIGIIITVLGGLILRMLF